MALETDSRLADPISDDIAKDQVREGGAESKENIPSISATGADEIAALPKGTIDPVYEAKARVLNHAVGDHLVRRMWSLY
jgi:hypothetical protein